MDWRTVLMTLALLYHVDGYSKYGRTCKDIGCLNSEVCVLAEDPCSFGHSSNCGTYPTCKKKSQVEGAHSESAQPAMPRPNPQSPSRDFNSPPNYPAPAIPVNNGGSHYGGNSASGDNSPYGGNPSSSFGGSNPNSPYGGNSPYGDHSPYGGSSSNGGNSPYGGSSSIGGNFPYGGNRGGSPYGGSNPNSGLGSGGKNPLDNIYNTINNFANGQGGQGLSNIFGNILGNLSKSGGLNGLFNTRPIMENPNYSSYSSNSRSNAQIYPSGNPAYQAPNQNKQYGQSARHNGATTNKPVSYGWNIG